MRNIGLRIDIDSVIDISIGLESIREILNEFDSRCTIFINMGTSISRYILLRDITRTIKNLKGKTSSGITKLKTIQKLGKKGFLETIFINPRIGSRGKKILHIMHNEGNELGLHGGKNHAIWQRVGDKKTQLWTLQELRWGKFKFQKAFSIDPIGFTCPGFTVPIGLEESLKKLGFIYHSDISDESEFNPIKNLIYNIPVNVIGPETMPIIEYLHIKGLNPTKIAHQILYKLEEILSNNGIPVIYGHPSVEGLILKDDLRKLLIELKQSGYTTVPLKELLDES
jgi:peptidoglycan/xylan/chitin deacetylase (PgdA/CDA1 family)